MENLLKRTIEGLSENKTTPIAHKLPIGVEAISKILRVAFAQKVKEKGNTGQVQIPEQLNSLSTFISNDSKRAWVLLNGSVGTGKSTALEAIQSLYRELSENAKAELKSNRYKLTQQQQNNYEWLSSLPTPVLTSAIDICDLAREDRQKFDNVKKAPILMIDDIGVEPQRVLNYGTEISPLLEILYHRYDKRKLTMLSSNKDELNLGIVYGDRMADRLKELASLISFTGKSFR